MYYRLRNGLSYCKVDGNTVMLDLAADRYSLLPQAKAFALAMAETQKAQDLVREALKGLLDCGLLEAGPAANGPQPCRAPPVLGDTKSSQPTTANALLVAEMVGRQIAAKRRLRRLGLQETIERIRSRKVRAIERAGTAGPIPDAAIAAFFGSQKYLASHDQCLPRGIALIDLLASRRIYPDLVLGVRFPFAAHCWVQWEGTVLTDYAERVRSYTPILVI